MHLGQKITVAIAREILGPRQSLVQLQDANSSTTGGRAGADYLGTGAIFPQTHALRLHTSVKTLKQIQQSVGDAGLRHCGLNAGNVAAVKAGVDGVRSFQPLCGGCPQLRHELGSSLAIIGESHLLA